MMSRSQFRALDRKARSDFFYKNAGFSYPTGSTQDEIDGCRRHHADELADAWAWYLDKRLASTWKVDPHMDSSDFSDEKPTWDLYECMLWKGDDCVESLSGIDLGRGETPAGNHDYQIVVVAELALSYWDQCRRDEEERERCRRYREAAKRIYVDCTDDAITMDDDAKVSECDDGAFVQVWGWVSNEEARILLGDEPSC